MSSQCIFCNSDKIDIQEHRKVALKQFAKIEDLEVAGSGAEVELLFFYINALAEHLNHLVERVDSLAQPRQADGEGGDE